MRRSTLLIIVIAVVIAMLAGVWFFLVAPALDDDAEEPRPPASSQRPEITLKPGEVEGVPHVPGDDVLGEYEPLEVSPGVAAHFGAKRLPAEVLTTSENVSIGEQAVIFSRQPESSADAYVLVQVDEVSSHLQGAEREAALARLGGSLPGTVVQRVTGRARLAAGDGALENWNALAALRAESTRLEEMPTSWDDSCAPKPEIFAGIEDPYDVTVQFCFYAYGTVNVPEAPISAIIAEGEINGQHSEIWVPSDKWQDGMFDPAHEHDEHEHDEHEHE